MKSSIGFILAQRIVGTDLREIRTIFVGFLTYKLFPLLLSYTLIESGHLLLVCFDDVIASSS